MKSVLSHLELLEARIAPASVITYTDVDGDRVKITSSKGNLEGHAVFVPLGEGQQLISLDLTDDSFAKTNLRITVKRAPGGDGFANVGFINAADNDLGRVLIRGDVGRIVVGDSNEGTPAIKVLRVHSLGQFGTSTQSGTGGDGSLPIEVLGIVNDLLGENRAGDGLLGDLSSSVSELLGNPTLLDGVSDTVARLLASLQANLDTLLGLTGAPGTLPGGATGLLSNIETLISDLLGEGPEVTSLLGPALTDTLTDAGGQIGDLLNTILPDGEVSVDVGDLLGLNLGALLGINLGGLGNSVGSTLQTLGTTVENLLSSPESGQLPPNISELLGQVQTVLDPILQGVAPLTNDVVSLLSRLQTELAGLLGAANVGDDVLDPSLQATLQAVNSLASDLLSGGSASAVAEGLSSDFRGNVGLIQVDGSVRDVFLNVQGDLRKIVIRGDLAGGELVNGGQLLVAGNLGSLRIGKNLIGGGELNSGNVIVNGKVGSISIGGSIIGTDGVHSGAISLQSDLRSLSIKGDLAGGDGAFSGTVINDNGGIRKVLIRGSLIAGDGEDSGSLRVSNNIAHLQLKGSIVGDSDNRVEISAAGLESKRGTKDPAFGKIQVGGSVNYADLLAGYDTALQPVNGDAQVNSVFVRRDWIASSISAGVESPLGIGMLGAEGDTVISEGNTGNIISRIAKIRINGSVAGTSTAGDQFGFVAEQVTKLVIHKSKVPLSPGANNDVELLSQATGDVVVREVGTVAQT